MTIKLTKVIKPITTMLSVAGRVSNDRGLSLLRFGRFGAMVATGVLGLSAVASAQLPSEPTVSPTSVSQAQSLSHIVVVGKGKVMATPDMAHITLQVSQTEDTLTAAKQAVDKRVAQILGVAKTAGLEEADVSASRISASPEFQWRNQKQVKIGEQVRRQVRLTLRDIERYNELVNGLLGAGVTELHQSELRFSQKDQLEAKALAKALDHAKQQAESLASHLGASVAGVYQIAPVNDHPVSYQRGFEMKSRVADAKSAPEGGLQVGEQALEQRIRVVFWLKN